MLRRTAIVALLLITVFWPALAATTPTLAHRHIIVVSVDGLKPDYYLEADRLKLKIPMLRRMMSEGSYARANEPVLPPVTYDDHAAIATGARPAVSGIPFDSVVDWAGDAHPSWYWYSKDFKVTTLWDAVQATGRTAATIVWPTTVGANSRFDIPEYESHPSMSESGGSLLDLSAISDRSHPALMAADLEEKVRTGLQYPLRALHLDPIVDMCVTYVEKEYAPDLLLMHLPDVDTEQHKHGPFSKQALAAVERADGYIKRVYETAVQKVNAPVTMFVVSDHGFLAVHDEIEMWVLLAENGFLPIARPAPNGGFCGIYVAPNAPAAQVHRLHGWLVSLCRQHAANGLVRVWERSELDRWEAFPGAMCAVQCQPGFDFGYLYKGPAFRKSVLKGDHGYDPRRPDQQASFLALGNGIKRGVVLDQIHMIDVGPTVAYMMGARLPQAEGHPVLQIMAHTP
jgi:predicted AlkP superfamily pyrophosphatase or phosphodiesterase